MAPHRLKAVAAFVVALGLVQVLVEDVLVFMGATGVAPAWLASSRYVFLGVPMVVATLLIVVLIGGAILTADDL